MAEDAKPTVYKRVDLKCKINNAAHRTSEISEEQLIVRRGQSFTVTLELSTSFNPVLHPLVFVAETGYDPFENLGTRSVFGVPDNVTRSPTAKAVWKAELDSSSSRLTGLLNLVVTPPADAPIGEYQVNVTHKDEEMLLAKLLMLFNPWCSDDAVFLSDEEERHEYVMNEQGIIYGGSGNYIAPRHWDFGQFEDDMAEICMYILLLNHKHTEDPAADAAGRYDPAYVGRVVSAMINSEDDHGVLEGRWEHPYLGGVAPTHWDGSHAILARWVQMNFHPVKYGQCWVFAGVMCSVMRLLGIPCRVVSNFESAHDNNSNLTIDVYHADYGVEEIMSTDSVWNFHVWVEAWMKRPDLAEDGKYDGWQVLDPTPQEMSDGVYCCGPAPVIAILNGETDKKYDVPFVLAEVNADCIDWLVKKDGSKVKIWSDTSRVGQNISTKSVGSDDRLTITNTYKHKEGSEEERAVFQYAVTTHITNVAAEENREMGIEEEGPATTNGTNEETPEEEIPKEETPEEETPKEETPKEETPEEETPEEETPIPLPPLTLQFDEVSKPVNGTDVNMTLVLQSDVTAPRPLSINITVQALTYNGTLVGNIKTEVKDETLQPGKDLSVNILIPYSAYRKLMMESDSMRISAVVTDKQEPSNVFLAEDNIVLADPPITVSVSGPLRLFQESYVEVVFTNPIDETLTNCTLTLTGSGLLRTEVDALLPDLKPNRRIRAKCPFWPYKKGQKTLMADFSCSAFTDIKGSCSVLVEP